MAPRRTRRPSPPLRPAAQHSEDDQRDALSELLAELGSVEGYRLKLQRETRETPTSPKIWAYVATVELTPELLEEVRREHGGGYYRAQLMNENGYVRGRVTRFMVAGKPKEETPRAEPKPEKPEKSVSSGAMEVVTMITTIIGAVTPLLAPLLKRDRAEVNPQSVTDTLKLVNDAEARGEARGRELGGLLAGGGSSSSDALANVARELVPPLISLATEQMRTQRTPAPSNGQQPPVVLPAADLPPEYVWLTGLRPFYSQLKAEADRNNDPLLVADYALSRMPLELLAHIHRAAVREDFRPVMQGELADIHAQQPAWLDEFLNRITEDATAPAEQEPVPILKKIGGKKR